MKTSLQLENYNFREHATRRIKYDFKTNKDLPTIDIDNNYKFGLSQLELLKRQSIISKLYPENKSVISQLKK